MSITTKVEVGNDSDVSYLVLASTARERGAPSLGVRGKTSLGKNGEPPRAKPLSRLFHKGKRPVCPQVPVPRFPERAFNRQLPEECFASQTLSGSPGSIANFRIADHIGTNAVHPYTLNEATKTGRLRIC